MSLMLATRSALLSATLCNQQPIPALVLPLAQHHRDAAVPLLNVGYNITCCCECCAAGLPPPCLSQAGQPELLLLLLPAAAGWLTQR
jgi:hypothetical protein